ncbi:exodeoxyribonuclease VII small subunit [Treponema sp.]|uniref:exodeoxyribonuclease VII small subunit n=1 Tax=Treponema sp. TaxID=166 RepID=UPI00298D6542|nr:exodeoxyribonuclease VII small subunit [Treponema sp.]MCI6441636.1 exodeoxyribonuclease VII small subunit [Spirochaetia bacterium]MDY4132506.1 exodeoxyribonuclease VII small subunit [Treponema sp.]
MTNFEEKLEKLEKLSENIKQSDISLEDALKNFEEGIKLAKTLEKELDKMEDKIQILMNGEETKDGKVELGLFDETTEITGTRS